MIDKAMVATAIRSPRTKKNGLRALIAFIAIGILGFFVLPPIVKSILLEKLSEALHRPVSVQSVSINPYVLSLQVDGVAIQEKGGGETVASFDSLYVNLASSSLFRGGPVISEIRLLGPKLKIVRLADNRYNFSDLIDEMLAQPESPTPTPTAGFSLNNIQVSGGSIEFDDRPVDKKHLLTEIKLNLPFVSSLAYATETFVEPAFSANLNGALLAMTGKSKPFADSLESELLFNLDNLQIGKYFAYAPLDLPVKVISGVLDGDLKIVFRQEKNKPSALSLSGAISLKDLLVKEASDTPLVSIKNLELSLAAVDLLNKKFAIDRITIDLPEVHTRVSRQGVINWLDLVQRMQSPAQAGGKSASPVPVPEWSIAEARLSGGILHWFDESGARPVRVSIEGLNLALKKLANKSLEPAEFDVALRVNAGELLKVDAVSIKEGRLDLVKREVSLGDVSVRTARMQIRRVADGSIDWLKPPLLRAVQSAQKSVEQEAEKPWKLSMAKYRSEDIGVRFEDKMVSPVAVNVIEGLVVEIDDFSLEPGQSSKVATRFKLNGKGSVDIAGDVTLLPLNANLKLDVKAIHLLPLQAYFSEKLNIAVTRGQLSIDGALQLRQAANSLAGGFSGKATIGDFTAVDITNSADFLKWKSLYFGKVDLHLNPDSLSIEEVALADFFARIIVSPEGKLNLMQIVRKDDQLESVSVVPEKPEEPAAAKEVKSADGKAVVPIAVAGKPQLPVKIGKITLQEGTINFSDNFVKPNYSARLRKVGGRISGLSSEPDSIASLELRGSYDNVAPLNLTAKINPLSPKPFLDLQADVKGIEMTSLSAYAAKYAGYAIDKGKLSLFVKYKIENGQLEAENNIFLDQLTFGEAIDSPDATRLPVTLAVSLLKNRRGEIDLDLPISGSLDDPQFSIGGLIMKVIANVFIKAVTSPFALLGSLFGGGEELSNIEFDYGRAALMPAALTRLESLSKALTERPALKLEIEGRVDLDRDPEGLKLARIDRKVRALKREDLTKKGIESGSLRDIEISAQEYPVLLERVYHDEKFPKPRNMIGMQKSIPVEEMEKLMLANTTVNEDDLLALGDRRSKVVRDWLVNHEIPAERVFLLPTRLSKLDSKEDKSKASRVNFSLK